MADTGEKELIIHADFAAPSLLIVFRDRAHAQTFTAGAHAYRAAGTRGALVLIEVRENLMRG